MIECSQMVHWWTQSPGQVTGGYKVHEGQRDFVSKGGDHKVKGVYLIDIIYGQKWGYVWGWTPRATGELEIRLRKAF